MLSHEVTDVPWAEEIDLGISRRVMVLSRFWYRIEAAMLRLLFYVFFSFSLSSTGFYIRFSFIYAC